MSDTEYAYERRQGAWERHGNLFLSGMSALFTAAILFVALQAGPNIASLETDVANLREDIRELKGDVREATSERYNASHAIKDWEVQRRRDAVQDQQILRLEERIRALESSK